MELKLRPVARLVKIIGEHLIRDNTTGVMELIKNGYDADANKVTVELRNLADPETTEIVIEDDGDGMEEEIIAGPWSEPAHGGKEQAKAELKRTKKGRLPLGEKGVGRFAAQRLGRYLELVTRPENGKFEYYVKLDWDLFDSTTSYIDQVTFPLEKRAPKVFDSDRHGTRLVIRAARTPWGKKDVANLQAHLMRLLSPGRTTKDFAVSLKCVEHPEFENLEPSEILDKFQFKIDCSIDKKGVANYTYSSRKEDGSEKSHESRVNVWSNVSEEWQKFDPQCGPFRIVIYAWIKKVDNLKEYGITKAQLGALSGISIYRDGFRIIPYGDEGDDWLGLNKRRVLRPGQTYDNDQVIGRVEINQENNLNLKDKTSREGLQENQAYFDIRDLVLGVVTLLETESTEQRGKVTKQKDTSKDLEKQLEVLKAQVEELKSASKEKPDLTISSGTERDAARTDVDGSRTIIVPVAQIEQLESQTKAVERVTQTLLKEVWETEEEKREAFLHLVGMGLVAERFAHEFDRSVGVLSANLKKLEAIRPFDPNVKALRLVFDTLKSEVTLMGAGRYVRKPAEPVDTDVNDIIDMVLKAHAKEFGDYSIDVEKNLKDGFKVRIPQASLAQVIDNVIANAIYWLNQKSEVNDRKISIVTDDREREILICNNGPKIQPNIKRVLFTSPFRTSKPDGRGIGMYLSNEIMTRNKGSIELIEENSPDNKYGSAAFRIGFE